MKTPAQGQEARRETLERLRALEPVLRERGLTSLTLFGSMARGEARTDSDVDVSFETRDGFTLIDQIRIQEQLEDALGRSVDVLRVHAEMGAGGDGAREDRCVPMTESQETKSTLNPLSPARPRKARPCVES